MVEPSDQDQYPSSANRISGGAVRALVQIARVPAFFYSGAISIRNAMFDAGMRQSRRLPRPVISVGNITAGGTGKTPVIRWLADRMREDGLKVCILSRGYKAKRGELGDELMMLGRLLNQPGKQIVELRADPRRFAAGESALRDDQTIDLFLLDDGFQHRMLARDLDVVLINATEPFGFGHVLPAGLLREPMKGLRRASLFVITRADLVDETKLAEIERSIRRWNCEAPVFRASHAMRGFRSAAADASATPDISLESLKGKKWMALSGIADPNSLVKPLASLAGHPVNCMSFGDHHDYSEADLLDIRRRAIAQNAEVLVTTEKDWVKLARYPIAFDDKLPIWRAEMQIEFQGDGEAKLLDVVRARLLSARPL